MAKKKCQVMSLEDKRKMIELKHPSLSLRRQCELLSLCRSTVYYRPEGEDEYNEYLMRLLDEQYTRTPFYGVRRMTASLRQAGEMVNAKRVRRLLHLMGLEALYPKKSLSQPGKGHRVFPYLLRGIRASHPNHIWSTDITYIPLTRGFVYLVAIMDWYSRYVLTWELSESLESDFCISALERALKMNQPKIFNSDQGCQFTSKAFTKCLLERDISVSMDGRGRAFDNIFVERLWRTVKYEEVYLKDYRSPAEAKQELGRYLRFYNSERIHQNLDYRTPEAVYFENQGRTETSDVVCVTPVGLRPPSVTQTTKMETKKFHLKLG